MLKQLASQLRPAAARRNWQRFRKFNPYLLFVRRALFQFRIRHVSGPKTIRYGADELVVVCVFRNGGLHLKSFLQHYRSMGVRHFVFLDNGSTDGSPSMLGGHDDLTLFTTSAPYSVYENVMKTHLVERFCRGQWCLFADVDELFDYPWSRNLPLAGFLSYLNQHGYNAVITQMLDMFCDDNLLELRSSADDSLKARYPFYDISPIKKRRYRSPVPDKRIVEHFGGIRLKVFGTRNGLTKVSLFRLDGSLVPFVDWHHVENSRIADVTAVLLHYPFVETFVEKVREAVRSARYGYLVDNEYGAYLRGLAGSPRLTLKQSTAETLADIEDLLETGFLVASDRYRKWVSDRDRSIHADVPATAATSPDNSRGDAGQLTPQVSFIVPVYNAADTLVEALDAIRNQSSPAWEAVIVDDGSTDASLSIAQAAAQGEPRFRVISQPNRGASAARNAGIARARGKWLAFLDSDDWIAPDYVERMTGALSARPELDAVVCRWVMVYPGGQQGRVGSCRDIDRLFARTIVGYPFVIHACLVRKHLVDDVGGFNEALKTCEEWHLWQKIARTGARFGAVDDVLAFYRKQSPHTLSTDSDQVLEDALVVIRLGLAPTDPDVKHQRIDLADKKVGESLASSKYSALIYWGTMLICKGRDADLVWTHIDEGMTFEVDTDTAAGLVLGAMVYAVGKPEEAALDLWPQLRPRLLDFLDRLETFTGAPRLAARITSKLARAMILHRPDRQGAAVEGHYGFDLEVFADIADVAVGDAALDVGLGVVSIAGQSAGSICLPISGGRIPAEAIRRVLADRFADSIVAAVMSKLPAKDVPPRQRASPSALVELLLAGGTPGGGAAASPRIVDCDGAEPPVVDLTEALPELVANDGDEIDVVATLGGACLGRYRIAITGRRMTADTLSRAITTAAGPDLVGACLRQAVIGQEIAGLDEMRRRLRGTGEKAGTQPPPDGVLSLNGIAACLVTEAGRVRSAAAGRGMFESLFARAPDPWKYANDYESVKYDQTLSLMPPGPIRNALEIACAEGHFTEMLAPRVDSLIAADISQIALERAALRAQRFGNVSYRHLDLQTDDIGGDFDLIVCSEVLYFLGDRERLGSAAGKLADALGHGGHLIMAHANVIVDEPDKPGFDWPHQPYGARTISDVFSAQPQLRLVREIRTPLYRVQAFRKVAPGQALAQDVERVVLREQPAPVPESVAETVRWQGGYPSKSFSDDSGWATSIPILAYHRIAPPEPGPPGRYSVDPEMFARQLSYLRDAGFHALTWDSLRIHLRYRLPLPGRPVLLTFDDGYRDFREVAWPLLQEHGFTATVFVCPAHVGRTNAWDKGAVPLLDWSDIGDLAAEGVSFGAHSLTHVPLTALSVAEARAELAASKQALEEHLGAQVTVMAYPHGDFDPLVEHLARDAGYEMCVTTRNRQCRLTDPLTALPRMDVHGDMSFDQFVLAATGNLDKSAGPVQKLCAFLEGLNRPDRALQTARDWSQRCSGQGDYQFHLARLLDRQEIRADALDAYRRAVELEPGRADYAIQLSRACSGQSLHEEALEVAERAVLRVPDSGALLLHLGSLLMRAGRFGEAESALRRAIEIKPDMAHAHEHLVAACERQGRFDEALALAERSAAQFPDSAGLQKRLANLRARATTTR